MPIRKYSPELLNLAEWPKVDVSVLSEEDRVRYLRLEGAIKAACNDEKSSSVTARFGVSRSLLSYYLKRCTENHSDGRLMGFRALIPNSERKAYRSVAEERRVTDMGAGYAGAFQQLLLNYPASARWLEKKLSPQNSGIRSAGLNINSLHKDFLTQLRKEGASIVGYPFNTVRHGYSALAAYIRRRINEGDNDIALLKYGEDAQISLGSLCTNHRAVCICGLRRSAALQILAIATAIAAFCALQPIPIRSAHLPLDSCRGSLVDCR